MAEILRLPRLTKREMGHEQAAGRRQLEDERPCAILGGARSSRTRLTRAPVPEDRSHGVPAGDAAGPARYVLTGSRSARRQDCHPLASGAHTGDISAEMLADAGATACHRRPFRAPHRSRRDRRPGECQGRAAHRAGLTAIICIGETEAERQDGATSKSSAASCKARCHRLAGRTTPSSPMSRSGRSAQALRRPRPTWPSCTASSATSLVACSARPKRAAAHPLWRLGQARQCQRTPIRA